MRVPGMPGSRSEVRSGEVGLKYGPSVCDGVRAPPAPQAGVALTSDTWVWAPKTEALEGVLARTPTGRFVQMADVTNAAVFLLENPSMHGTELRIDGGWSLT